MSRKTFEVAYLDWNNLIGRESETAYPTLETAEQVILDYMPATAADAVKIVHVLKANAEIGPRGDGRDVQALARLREWLEPLGNASHA